MVLVKIALLIGSAILAAVMIIWIQSLVSNRGGHQSNPKPDGDTGKKNATLLAAFLFSDEQLVQETGVTAAELIGHPNDTKPKLSELVDHLSCRFPTLYENVETLPETGKADLVSADGKLDLSLNISGLETELRLNRRATEPYILVQSSPQTQEFENEELASLRTMAKHLPYVVWCEDNDGQVIWANAAYLDLVGSLEAEAEFQTWPPQKIFELPDVLANPTFSGVSCTRVSLSISDQTAPAWYDVTAERLEDRTLYSATSVDEVVAAEQKLNVFIQTLTKTFAHLDTGLAIFDRSRKLTLFNPALVDLTGLRPEFMIGRPGIHAFLDRLRDRRMIPEPKDYKSWRQQVYELESEAAEGTYEDTWSLPDGRTFHVTGRPHPDGAVALMFKNVSNEIALSREHRIEIETYQGALDSLEEAVAVFDRSGRLTLRNKRYVELWEMEEMTDSSNSSLFEASATWSAACAPSPIWGDIRAFSGSHSERTEWTASARLKNGKNLRCRVVPTSRGSTLVAFSMSDQIEVSMYETQPTSIPPLVEQGSVQLEHS